MHSIFPIKPNKKNSQYVTLYIDKTMLDKLEKISYRYDISRNAVIVAILEEYLREYPPE